MEGFFYIAYTGHAGSGFGLLAFVRGIVAGADLAGSTYRGSYTDEHETLTFSITMSAPAGITPVQTGIPIAAPMEMPIKGSLTLNELENGSTVLVETPLGPVNAIFKKISDFPFIPVSPIVK